MRERETHPVRSWHPLLNNSRVMDRQTVKINGRANLPNPPVIPTTDDDVRSTHYDYTHTRLLAAPRLPLTDGKSGTPSLKSLKLFRTFFRVYCVNNYFACFVKQLSHALLVLWLSYLPWHFGVKTRPLLNF